MKGCSRCNVILSFALTPEHAENSVRYVRLTLLFRLCTGMLPGTPAVIVASVACLVSGGVQLA